MKTIIMVTIAVIFAIWFPWIAFGVFYASFLEWNLHKHLMHTNRKWFPYPFKAHTLVHHQIFRSDASYHLIEEKDKHTIPMAWWNGIVLAIIASIPIAIIGYMFGDYWSWLKVGSSVYGYYAVYEYMHWCMHLPKHRIFEEMQWYKDLKERHRIHHEKMGSKNFNVILPVADWLMNTYQAPNTP